MEALSPDFTSPVHFRKEHDFLEEIVVEQKRTRRTDRADAKVNEVGLAFQNRLELETQAEAGTVLTEILFVDQILVFEFDGFEL